MSEERIDQVMEDWLAGELGIGAALRPPEELRRRVAARRRRRRLPRVAALVAGMAAAAAVILLAVGDRGRGPRVVVKAWGVPEESVEFRGARPGAATHLPGRGPWRPFLELILQRHPPGTMTVVGTDLLVESEGIPALEPGTGYRLALTPAADLHLLVFQVGDDGGLDRLSPPDAGLLPAKKVRYVPARPDWFHLTGSSGGERLLILASERSLPDLLALYDRYRSAPAGRRLELRDRFLAEVESIRAAGLPATAVREFAFRRR